MNPEPEQLSETERHWNQICLTSVTIATAVMAAAFLISGLDEGRPDPVFAVNLARLICAGSTGVEKANLAVSKARQWAEELEEPKQDEEETQEQRIMREVVIAEIRIAAGDLETATDRWDS